MLHKNAEFLTGFRSLESYGTVRNLHLKSEGYLFWSDSECYDAKKQCKH